MKELLFRQKKKSYNNGDMWHYWGYVEGGKGCFVSPLSETQADGDSQQFTGSYDNTGVNIYEGDVVRSGMTGSEYLIYWNEDLSCFYKKPVNNNGKDRPLYQDSSSQRIISNE